MMIQKMIYFVMITKNKAQDIIRKGSYILTSLTCVHPRCSIYPRVNSTSTLLARGKAFDIISALILRRFYDVTSLITYEEGVSQGSFPSYYD